MASLATIRTGGKVNGTRFTPLFNSILIPDPAPISSKWYYTSLFQSDRRPLRLEVNWCTTVWTSHRNIKPPQGQRQQCNARETLVSLMDLPLFRSPPRSVPIKLLPWPIHEIFSPIYSPSSHSPLTIRSKSTNMNPSSHSIKSRSVLYFLLSIPHYCVCCSYKLNGRRNHLSYRPHF